MTDVGSTKKRICALAAEFFSEGPLFLGGHPMAGKERSGLENSDARLFENARYVLTPLKPQDLDDPRVKAFRDLVTLIGARPLISDPGHPRFGGCLPFAPSPTFIHRPRQPHR